MIRQMPPGASKYRENRQRAFAPMSSAGPGEYSRVRHENADERRESLVETMGSKMRATA
jgi:hypothetical protein